MNVRKIHAFHALQSTLVVLGWAGKHISQPVVCYINASPLVVGVKPLEKEVDQLLHIQCLGPMKYLVFQYPDGSLHLVLCVVIASFEFPVKNLGPNVWSCNERPQCIFCCGSYGCGISQSLLRFQLLSHEDDRILCACSLCAPFSLKAILTLLEWAQTTEKLRRCTFSFLR